MPSMPVTPCLVVPSVRVIASPAAHTINGTAVTMAAIAHMHAEVIAHPGLAIFTFLLDYVITRHDRLSAMLALPSLALFLLFTTIFLESGLVLLILAVSLMMRVVRVGHLPVDWNTMELVLSF